MRDPHIVSLRYNLETIPERIFHNPRPIEYVTNQFEARLADDILVLNMKEHYASAESAILSIADFLLSWEIHMALQLHLRSVHFSFQNAEVIDRNPPLPDEKEKTFDAADMGFGTSALMSLKVTCTRYPAPPKYFKIGPDVETLWRRYEGYLNKKEPLLSMAYFCRTVVTSSASSDQAPANKYSIHPAVLKKLGELTSTRGGSSTARKVNRNIPQPELTPSEVGWIKACIEAIIRRVAEQNSPSPQTQLTMTDLPKL